MSNLSSFLLCASFPHSSTLVYLCVLRWSGRVFFVRVQPWGSIAMRPEEQKDHYSPFSHPSFYSFHLVFRYLPLITPFALHINTFFFCFVSILFANCAFVSVGGESFHTNNTNHVFLSSCFSFVLVSFPGNKATRIKNTSSSNESLHTFLSFFLSFLYN